MKYKYNSILKYTEKNNYSKNELYFSLLARESLINNNEIHFMDMNNYKYVVKEIIEKSREKISDKELDSALTFLLERYSNQKGTGTYYTPNDVTSFMSKFLIKKYKKGNKIMDPTAGTGSLLLKLINSIEIDLKNIYAMDIDDFAIGILKQRLFIKYFNGDNKEEISVIINENIYVNDILNGTNKKVDIVISNPPYFELKKGISKYGNIYADSLDAICESINDGGSLSIIIPISFQSTSRMTKIREMVTNTFSEISIFSFSDRPGSLFKGVHQKLNIVNCSITNKNSIKTSNYLMWRNDNRDELFKNIKLFKSHNIETKVGTRELSIFFSQITSPIQNINSFLDEDGVDIFISSRIAQWGKAVIAKQETGEYTVYRVKKEYAKQITAIFNSNSYFVYWSIVSDGWHNTKKNIEGFKIDEELLKSNGFEKKCDDLLKSLEKTKEYIGSVQTDYIYRHRLSKKEIDVVDKHILKTMGLESDQIINFEKGAKNE